MIRGWEIGKLARAALPWVVWLSILTFVGSLILVPILIVRMPADYFVRRSPPPGSWRARHPLIRVSVLLAKNCLGAVFLVAGLVMLVTPGQGVLVALLGLSLLDVPGKRGLERRLIGIPSVLRAVNHIRTRAGQPPLELPPATHGGSDSNVDSSIHFSELQHSDRHRDRF